MPGDATQNRLGPDPVREQSASDEHPTGTQVPAGPHTVPLNG